MKLKSKRKIKIALISLVVSLVLLIGGFYIYTLDYYRADEVAIEVLSRVDTGSQIEKRKDMWIFHPDNEKKSDVGLIFYPGGKVEWTAYSVLLEKLSQNGITSVLIKMPFNLAVFDINAANRVYNQLPEINNWMIGGHSLGGAMASSYANDHQDIINGLVLLGAYPVDGNSIPTIALYGTEDMVLDKSKLATTQNQYVIPGGNHAYFGNYGEQKGDGIATITREEQQQLAVEEISTFILDSQ
ncbi:alpha/beta hydrolase [Paenibacillus endoradicis]|uniref:alpha/beta hydrolase n=1 Tax=Paenibacillus endoradicis TaxID=2972487 RepID=UPI002158DD0C|nr:alpha/beta hydrolase [Paenibacillus endoradicis]MCR8659772.1 alpha/beta hydrolase [Paenibacillus endoradicis]